MVRIGLPQLKDMQQHTKYLQIPINSTEPLSGSSGSVSFEFNTEDGIQVLMDSTNSFTIAMSCASNVGPTLGLEIGPTMSWSHIPDIGKWICAILMLIGRLEFFSVIVLFTPSFWKEN